VFISFINRSLKGQKMKQTKLSLLVAGLMASGMMISGQAIAAGNTDNATGDITANVIQPLTIVAGAALAFGEVIAGDGDKEIAPSADAAGTFTVAGEPNASYSITLPDDETVTLSNGAGGSMDVITFKHDAGATPALDVDGSITLKVGATLVVAELQASGSYTGTYDVIVAYE
jgi:hypothetical protein